MRLINSPTGTPRSAQFTSVRICLTVNRFHYAAKSPFFNSLLKNRT
jgi:hypothetical protein